MYCSNPNFIVWDVVAVNAEQLGMANSTEGMVIILVGNSEIGVHVKSKLC